MKIEQNGKLFRNNQKVYDAAIKHDEIYIRYIVDMHFAKMLHQGIGANRLILNEGKNIVYHHLEAWPEILEFIYLSKSNIYK